MKTLDAILAEQAFFKGLAPEYLELIAGCGSNVHFVAGQTLFREGEEADRFYAIRHGKVAVELHVPQRGSVVIHTVGEGDLLGWSWLFPPYLWQFDARAVEEVRATQFDGTCLRKKCDANPALGYELMKRLAHVVSDRLQDTRLQLLDMYGPAHHV